MGWSVIFVLAWSLLGSAWASPPQSFVPSRMAFCTTALMTIPQFRGQMDSGEARYFLNSLKIQMKQDFVSPLNEINMRNAIESSEWMQPHDHYTELILFHGSNQEIMQSLDNIAVSMGRLEQLDTDFSYGPGGHMIYASQESGMNEISTALLWLLRSAEELERELKPEVYRRHPMRPDFNFEMQYLRRSLGTGLGLIASAGLAISMAYRGDVDLASLFAGTAVLSGYGDYLLRAQWQSYRMAFHSVEGRIAYESQRHPQLMIGEYSVLNSFQQVLGKWNYRHKPFAHLGLSFGVSHELVLEIQEALSTGRDLDREKIIGEAVRSRQEAEATVDQPSRDNRLVLLDLFLTSDDSQQPVLTTFLRLKNANQFRWLPPPKAGNFRRGPPPKRVPEAVYEGAKGLGAAAR